jgi:hypothetical protein
MRKHLIAAVLAVLPISVGLPGIASATPSPSEGDGPCGQVTVWGKPEVVSAFPITCDEAMAVANKMTATWQEGMRYTAFDGWECAGVTAGEASMGDWWDYHCENSGNGAKVVFEPPGS